MRVALFDYSLFYESLGLANLMGALKAKNHDYKLFIISEEKDIIESVKQFNPDLLSFSVCTGIHHISFGLARYLRKHMRALTVFGGPHVTLFPEESIKEDCVDIICRGDGEEALIELLDALKNRGDYSQIKNLWVKKDGQIFRNEIRPLIENLDSLPLPDRSQYLKYPIVRDLPLKRFITGYGCPFQCSFCYNAMFLKEVYKGKGNYLRKKSVDRVFLEIKEVQKISTVKRIHFHDDNFNFYQEWFKEFCERYAKEIGLPWSCTVRVDNMLNEEVVKMMHEAGCVGVTYGLETHNENVRNKILNKHLKNEDFEKASKLFKKYKIKHIAAIMLNLPGETIKDAFATLHFARKLNSDIVRAALYNMAKKQPIIDWLMENNYIDHAPEIDNFNPTRLEDVAIHSPDMERMIRLSAFFNIMLKFPFLEPLFRFLSFFPIGRFGRSRMYDSYLEMRFMGVPPLQGFKYFLKVRQGFKAFQNLR